MCTLTEQRWVQICYLLPNSYQPMLNSFDCFHRNKSHLVYCNTFLEKKYNNNNNNNNNNNSGM